ncbi:MAG TPA: triose-phosphate isomerase [Edaphocola sp.]|nr:triose-phosphate isomerase [Edaphocola sp.]
MTRKKIVAGNWKMNQNLFEGKQLVEDIINSNFTLEDHQEVIIAPPFIQLSLAAGQLKDKPGIFLSAQNCHQKQSGAYTGEVSAEMLKSTGVDYVILGHSERREYFSESVELLAEKVDAALEKGLKVIFCVGEPLAIRDANQQNDYVETQIAKSLFHLSEQQFADIVLAYEPIWAIGTGRTASKEQAQDMHAHIRKVIAGKFGGTIADHLTILYGGSCKPDNAKELFAQPDVDGGLIGGASLKAADFVAIVQAL